MVELKIRKLQANDLDQIMAIEADSFAKPWKKRVFLKELNNEYAYYIVGIYQGKIVSYLGAWLLKNRCHITNLATAKSYRRLAFATKLLDYLFDKLTKLEINIITLEVRKSNQKAQALYKKHDFIKLGIKKNYYSNNNEDAVLMCKRVER